MKFIRDEGPTPGTKSRSYTIIGCPEHMVQCLGFMEQEDPMVKYGYLVHEPELHGSGPQSVYMFRSGAKLYTDPTKNRNRWWICGYEGGGRDVRAAEFQLRAADHIRCAVNLMTAVEDTLHTARSLRPTYIGLWGRYRDGARTPSGLN